jgi:hypothetical protein
LKPFDRVSHQLVDDPLIMGPNKWSGYVTHREFTADERTALRRLATGSTDWSSDASGAGCLFAVGLFVGLLLIRWLGLPRTPWQSVAAAVSAIAAIAAAIYMRRQRTATRHSQRYAEDLVRGRAEVTVYDVVDAIQVEESEDEGSTYYLKLANGAVLFLSGQYLYEAEEAKRFPSTRVVLTRAPASRTVLDLESVGTYLAPSSTRPPFSVQELRVRTAPDDGDELRDDFESLRTIRR